MALMTWWSGLINDVQGAFLKGELNQETERMAIKFPQGFKKYYDKNMVLLLSMAIYGTKQATMEFWIELLKCMKHMGYLHNGTAPCLHFK